LRGDDKSVGRLRRHLQAGRMDSVDSAMRRSLQFVDDSDSDFGNIEEGLCAAHYFIDVFWQPVESF
jgi:hypothetical protein